MGATGMDARAMLADTWWPRLVGRPGRPGTPDLGLRAGRPAQQGLSPGETVHQAPFTALRALAAPRAPAAGPVGAVGFGRVLQRTGRAARGMAGPMNHREG